MAGNNPRDVHLPIRVDVRGAQEIESLTSALDDAAASGKALPGGFDAANKRVIDMVQASRDAAAAVDKATTEINASTAAQRDARDATARLTATTDAAGKRTEAYVSEKRRLRLAEIDARRAVEEGRDALARATAEKQRAGDAIRRYTADLRSVGTATNSSSGALSNLAGSVKGAVAGFIGLEGARRAGAALLSAANDTEKLKGALTQVYDSADIAAKQIDFLRGVAGRAKVDVSELSQPFISFSAAMQSAGIEAGVSNALFEATTRAVTTMGGGAEQAGRALTALAQMASKGRVSAEELRQQLGEALPGAMSLAARSLGITTAELDDLMASGKLLASDLLPAMVGEMQKLAGENTTLAGAFADVTNKTKGFLTSIADGGATDSMRTMVGWLGNAASAAVNLGNAGFSAARGAGAAAAALAAGKSPAEAFVNEMARGQERMDAFGKSAAAATAEAAKTDNWVKLTVAYGDVSKAATLAEQNAKRLIDARKAEGAGMLNLAALSGNEVDRLHAEAAASLESAGAQRALLDVQRQALAAAQQQRAELAAIANGRADRLAAIADLDDEIAKRTVVTTATQAQVGSLEVEATRREQAIKLYADNSAAVDQLREAYDAAQRSLAGYQELAERGVNVDGQLATAKRNAAMAESLYRDALNDSLSAMERNNASRDANLRLDMVGIKSRQDAAAATLAAAQATGDETAAHWASVEAKRAQIAEVQRKAQAQREEAQAAIAVAEAERAALDQSDPLYQAKAQEIDTRIHNAEAMLRESMASGKVVAGIEKEISALHSLRDAKKPASGSTGTGTSGSTPNKPAGNRTSDDFATNKDGSATGTFGSFMAMTTAQAVANGTSDDIEGARAEIAAAQQYFGRMTGAMSLRAAADLDALALAVAQRSGATARKPTASSSTPPVQRHVVQVGKHEVNTDAAGAASLKAMLDELMRQRGTAQ